MAQDTAYNGKLTIGTKVFQINSCDVDFHRNVGPDGRPSSTIYGGKIVLTAPISKEEELAKMMFNASNKNIDGKIEVWESGGAEGIFRTITFTNSFFANYREVFDVNGGNPFVCAFTISAETISVGSAKFDNKWPLTS